jgi:hypothetical protein
MIPLLILVAAGPVLPVPGDACAAPDPNAIVVCRHRAETRSPYRLPVPRDDGFDPLGPVDSVSRERHRLIDADGGAPDMTRGSCSAVGASGFTGCQVKTWRERDQQKGW